MIEDANRSLEAAFFNKVEMHARKGHNRISIIDTKEVEIDTLFLLMILDAIDDVVL